MSAANTGSAAHLLGAKCLTNGMSPCFYLGDMITPVEEPHSVLGASGCQRWVSCPGSVALAKAHPSPPDPPKPVKVDQRMIDGVAEYVDYVTDTAVGGELYVEKTFTLDWLFSRMFGTSDATIINRDRREAWVVDYKNGASPVDADWNMQLLYYAAGALHGLTPEEIQTVHLVIVQPNVIGETVKECTVSLEDVRAWAVEVLRPAAVATTRTPAPRHPGDHCKYCPGQKNLVCPELKKHLDAVSMNALTGPATPVENLPMEQKLQLVERLDMLVSMAKRAKEHLTYEAEQGTFQHPDWKLVRGRSTRKWVPGAEAQLINMFGSEIYQSKMKGLSAIEKLMKERGLDPKSVMPSLTEKPFAGYQLVPASDPRPAEQPTACIDLLK